MFTEDELVFIYTICEIMQHNVNALKYYYYGSDSSETHTMEHDLDHIKDVIAINIPFNIVQLKNAK